MSRVLDSMGMEFKEKARLYEVHLTNKEMQYIANGLTGFMNVMAQRQVQLIPEQALALVAAMQKFKEALASNKYKVVEIDLVKRGISEA